MENGKFFLRDFSIDNEFDQKGGEAIVSKAWHPRLGEVAIKRWTNAAYNVDDEIKLLIKSCDHHNIIHCLGILMNNESNYIGYIMPYMTIGSLDDVIHNKRKNYDEICTDEQKTKWITQICYGLSHLHFKKIIHRDIKPSNVLLGKSYDDVKLSDLGLARSVEKKINTLTTGLGTPLYMAPEMLRRQSYDISADIYSLSITIWEILYQRIPYDHVTDTFELYNMIHNGGRPELNNNLSKEVSDLLARCWHADASERPTIDYILDFSFNTRFLFMDLENSVNRYRTSFENLNAHNSESSSKTITAGKVERLKNIFEANNTKSGNVQNKITVVPKQILNDDERPPIPPKRISRRPLPNSIEKNSGKEAILLLGGLDNHKSFDTLLMLENNGQIWEQVNIKLPSAIHSHGAQFLNNTLYIFGGGTIENPYKWTYKLSKSFQWEKMTDMNKERTYISNSSVILNSQIWVCGGQKEKYKTLKSVEMYDTEANKWKYMRQMNQCRSFAAAAVLNGKIFCSGGFDRRPLNSVECYDPSSDVWAFISNMPSSILGHGAVEIHGNLIVIGGWSDESFKNVWALDTTDKKAIWTKKPSMSIPHMWFSIAKIDEKVFICGGEGGRGNQEIFDGEVWRYGPMISTYRIYAPAVVIPMQFARELEQFNAVSM